VNLAVVVCTRDRRELLLGLLGSLRGELGPEDELVVVDDGSRDGTAETARAWLDEHRADGVLLAEPGGGLSRARNAGLAAARAPVVCFLDDDETVEPGWADAYRAAWGRAAPEVGAIGGPMLPRWPGPRPVWLADRLLDVVSVLDLGPEPRRLDQRARTGFVWGGNLSVRAEAAAAVGGFDPALGLQPGEPWNRGDDEDLQVRLARAGWETWWDPGPRIRHVIPPERITVAHVRRVYRERGVRDARAGRPRLAAAPLVARGLARYAWLRARRSPDAPTALFTLEQGLGLATAPRRGTPPPGAPRARPS
jgi:glycosyltransferase involved in cell wall biosynthesis